MRFVMRSIWRPQALRERVAAAYRALIESLETIDRHPARFWNFIPDIGEPMVDGLDRYMVFNAGRHDAYGDQRGALGTASAVGIKGSDLSIHCLALEEPGTPVENPRRHPRGSTQPDTVRCRLAFRAPRSSTLRDAARC